MFDIFGVIGLSLFALGFGLKNIWMPGILAILGQTILIVFMAAWIRKSNVKTGAEWMETRFGNGNDIKKVKGIVVIFTLLSAVGFLIYCISGIMKIVEILFAN
jgi:Na+(H+)/acetate symporter ActP